MVSIEYDDSTKNLHIKISGDNFRELCETLKEEGCSWNQQLKVWTLPVYNYKEFVEALSSFDEIYDIDMLSKSEIDTYFKNLKELKIARRAYVPSLVRFPPLKGIPPNENYQLEDFSRGLCQNRFLYNHDMGLGKSWLLTALIEHKRYYKELYKCIIFSTTIGTNNLKDEILKFSTTIKPEDILVVTSITDYKFEDRDLFNVEKYPQSILVFSYDSFKSVSNYYYDKQYGTKSKPHPSSGKKYRSNCMPLTEWLEGKEGGLFLDECHSVGIPDSRRTEIISWLVDSFEYRYLFTGTLADMYQKLYIPCRFLDKALIDGKDYRSWLKKYNDIGTRFSKWAINKDGWRLDLIEDLNVKLLKEYGAKRLMKDCLDLPPNFEMPVIYMEMSTLQRKIYEAFSNFTAAEVDNVIKASGKGNFSHRMINLFPYLQQAVDNPACLVKSEKFSAFPEELQKDILKYDYNKHAEKAIWVDELIKELVDENGEKVILWYFHPETKDALMKRYAKYNPIEISAETPKDDRVPIVKNFLADDAKKILIPSINIMNTSLTAVECTSMIFVEKTYNYKDYAQACRRNWRPGQTKVTKIYSLRYDKSIDNLQELNLQTKGSVIDSLLSKEYIEKDLWKKMFSLQKDMSI